ncbi:substrate-binding domain-containing protein [Pseudomonas sp. B2M1-30]|uniref:substrate-binding domain-containing protein n=1 Tax=Pseudomonas TaxID=286 RepID=UPI0021C96A3F|nr:MULTISPECIES: substrate-binding domain-containing protein [Pseudomonas]MCU0121733.1 substrate-binding domain-containing protein [Pseudomonas sp. B2M1-30]MCU7263879.1 substrate-binding domain-containing protein [Pseudomonas koreensis]
MFKRTLIAASLTIAALSCAQAMAANVTGGGATLPAALYKGSANSILPANFSYLGTGSGTGKSAFLTNNSALFNTTGTVHFAGSDSILSASEISTYNGAFGASYGPLIQLPSVATSVAIPYKKTGQTALNLTSAQLCDVFSGTVTKWGPLLGTSDNTDIRVVYRNVSSGTTEILSRHLASICPTKFTVNSTFTNARLPAGSALPSNWVGVADTSAVASTVNAVDGSIGYVGPDGVNASSNAVVARVNGVQPTTANVTAALSTAPLPTAPANPAQWAPVVANPSTGYPISAYTNFIFGQCYKDATVAADVKAFLTQHYSVPGNTVATVAHGFSVVPTNWKNAVTANFVTNSTGNKLDINNASVCNTIGRP